MLWEPNQKDYANMLFCGQIEIPSNSERYLDIHNSVFIIPKKFIIESIKFLIIYLYLNPLQHCPQNKFYWSTNLFGFRTQSRFTCCICDLFNHLLHRIVYCTPTTNIVEEIRSVFLRNIFSGFIWLFLCDKIQIRSFWRKCYTHITDTAYFRLYQIQRHKRSICPIIG